MIGPNQMNERLEKTCLIDPGEQEPARQDQLKPDQGGFIKNMDYHP